MASLTSAELADRLALDYRSTIVLQSRALASVRAIKSESDLCAGRDVTRDEGEAGRAALYLVDYAFPILVGPGPTTPRALVRFDLLAGGNYPYSQPSVAVTSRPLPWSPHVRPSTGSVCLGEGWARAQGGMLLCLLVRHVMRLFNYDEPQRDPGYVGWNGAAVQYWRSALGGKPLHADLPYPVMATEVTHGVEDQAAAFQGVSQEELFRRIDIDFKAIHQPLGASGFRPL